VTIWLKPNSREQMDSVARDLYDRNSPNYRRWLTRSQIVELRADGGRSENGPGVF